MTIVAVHPVLILALIVIATFAGIVVVLIVREFRYLERIRQPSADQVFNDPDRHIGMSVPHTRTNSETILVTSLLSTLGYEGLMALARRVEDSAAELRDKISRDGSGYDYDP